MANENDEQPYNDGDPLPAEEMNATLDLNYDYNPEPVIGNFDDEADREAFVQLQEQNQQYADKLSEKMGDKGVPESKRPL